MQESYEKRFNILLHGLEARDETLKIIQIFMREELKIMQSAEIALADFYRLPRQPVLENGKTANRPITKSLSK